MYLFSPIISAEIICTITLFYDNIYLLVDLLC